MSLVDNRDSYGWISIILHWLSAGAVLFLWFVGQSAALAESDEARLPLLNLHVSVALFVASLIILRVLWRVLKGHPDVVNFARERVISRFFHHAMLAALVTMVASGLTMVLFAESGGSVYEMVAEVHRITARMLIIATIMHFCAAMYHLMFCDDDIFLRILSPKRKIQ